MYNSLKKSLNNKKNNGFLFVAALLFISIFSGCSDKGSALYEPTESNQKILMAYVTKNQQCGANRWPDFPVYMKATKVSVDHCVAEILATNCNNWTGTSSSLPMCLAVQLLTLVPCDGCGIGKVIEC